LLVLEYRDVNLKLKYYADSIIDDKVYSIFEEKELEINRSKITSANNIYVDIKSILNLIKNAGYFCQVNPFFDRIDSQTPKKSTSLPGICKLTRPRIVNNFVPFKTQQLWKIKY